MDGTVEAVTRLLRRPLGLDDVVTLADRELRRAIGFDVAIWAAVDPATLLMTDCRARWDVPPPGGERFDPAREVRLFELEWGSGDPNSYFALVRDEQPVGALRLDVGDPVGVVQRYDEVLAPSGVHDELRIVLRRADAVWGVVTCYRREPPAFDARVVDLARRLSPVLADLYRQVFLRAAVESASMDAPPGHINTTEEGDVVTTTAAAERYLDELRDEQVGQVLRSVVAAVRTGGPVSSVVVGDAGPVAFHGMPVKGRDGEFSVVVERPRPARLADTIMHSYGLTEREREVATAAVRGETSRRIAAALDLSLHTVNDHLKSIYEKAGVGSRGELAARLLTDHYLPRRERGETPGPYGFFV